MKFKNILETPIEITGLAVTEGDKFYRMQLDVIDTVSPGVSGLAKHTAGGCVRFSTDSDKVELKVTLLNTGVMSHMPLSGQSGTDVYFDGLFVTTVRADNPGLRDYTGTVSRPAALKAGVHTVEIFLPLYNGITAMEIGINDDAEFSAAPEQKYKKPVAFYGSSITQGGCASKPGNAYSAMLARWLDFPQINLGFSGSGKGEEAMVRYIATLDLSVFVMDYDHNAPDADYLRRTHKPFFDIIRTAHPSLPVIFVSKPDFDSAAVNNAVRRQVIFDTYADAVRANDKKVWYVDGETLFGHHDRLACTVDGCHPNDLGFYRMAETILPVLKEALDS